MAELGKLFTDVLQADCLYRLESVPTHVSSLERPLCLPCMHIVCGAHMSGNCVNMIYSCALKFFLCGYDAGLAISRSRA